MSLVEVKVPDIGDFKDVDVIEVNIKPGDAIEKEQSLLTLESDKASMEVPSDTAGTVKEIRIKAGDKVSQGTVIALVETSADAAPAKDAPKEAEKAPVRNCRSRRRAQGGRRPRHKPEASGSADIECDMLVLGSGPGGYSAACLLGRSRHEDGAGRALFDTRRRLSERRLYSVEGALAHRAQIDEAEQNFRRARHHVREAADRSRQAA